MSKKIPFESFLSIFSLIFLSNLPKFLLRFVVTSLITRLYGRKISSGYIKDVQQEKQINVIRKIERIFKLEKTHESCAVYSHRRINSVSISLQWKAFRFEPKASRA